MRRTCFLMVLFCACALFGCQNKPVSDMTDEEKVALRVAGQDELTQDEEARQREARQVILDRTAKTRAAELKLDQTLSEVKKLLSPADLTALDNAQNDWKIRGKGRDINALVAEGIDAADAYSEAVSLRADWVSTRAAWAMRLALNSLYRSGQGQMLEVYELGDRLNIVMRAQGNGIRWVVVTASGSWDGHQAVLSSEVDQAIRIRVTKETSGHFVLEWVADSAAGSTVGATFAPVFEGRYEPVKQGDFDVFAF